MKDGNGNPSPGVAGKRHSRLAGPPIFARPTAEELPPAERPWKKWVGLLALILAIVLVTLGVLGLLIHSGGVPLVVVGFVLVALGVFLLTADTRAMRAWRAEHEPPTR